MDIIPYEDTGRDYDIAVVESVQFVQFRRMSEMFQYGQQAFVLLISAEHLEFPVSGDQHQWSTILPDIVHGRIFIYERQVHRHSALFLDGEMGDNSVGLQARMMSKAMRRLSGLMNKTSCTIIFINQLREKIGVMYGNPETTTGGRALKFYASVRIEIRRSEAIKNGSEIVGNKVNIKVVKNKVSPPFKTTSVDIIYGKGIARDGEIIDLAVAHDIIDKSGAWYAYQGEKIGQGRENVKIFLAEHPDIMNEIEEKVKAQIFAHEEA